MATLLKDLKATSASIQEKVKLYNDCNREVAILCNHKRTVGASHEAQMEKIGDRVSLENLISSRNFPDATRRSRA
jgi:DNA topoisomerase I